MARSLTRTHPVLSGPAPDHAPTDPTTVRGLLRRSLARALTAMFVAVPLMWAVLRLGNPELLLTLGGLAALHLAADLLLERTGHTISRDLGFQILLMTWLAGLALLGAAGWTASTEAYHGWPVAVVGVPVAGFVGFVAPRLVAVLWGVAASAAVALGASLAGPATAETLIPAASVLVGSLIGAVLGEILQRVQRSRTA